MYMYIKIVSDKEDRFTDISNIFNYYIHVYENNIR